MIVRRALPIDRDRVLDLMSAAERTIVQMPWRELEQLAAGDHGTDPGELFLSEVDGTLVGVWGSVIEPKTVAHIRVFGVLDNWSLNRVMAVMLSAIGQVLHDRGARTLAFVGPQGWFLDALQSHGFNRVNSVVAMQKGDFAVPHTGNERVVIRPAVEDDFPAILAIEEAAFEPLWRNTAASLARQQKTSSFFTVAQLDGQVVGYAYGSLAGRHAHLTRIAVSPRHQGQGIGVRLLADTIRFCRERDVFGITLNTQQDNARAQRLYQWFGFRVLGKEADVVVMDLNSGPFFACQTTKSKV